MAKRYTSDVTDKQWILVKEYFDPERTMGRPRKHTPRELLNGILYLTRQGCSWRDLPKDFPPWGTVWTARRRWTLNGALDRAHEALARARARPLGSSIRHSSNPPTVVLVMRQMATNEPPERTSTS
jgi:putative transposase